MFLYSLTSLKFHKFIFESWNSKDHSSVRSNESERVIVQSTDLHGNKSMVGIPYFYTSIFEELPSAYFFYILKFESAIRDKEFEVGTRYALLHTSQNNWHAGRYRIWSAVESYQIIT